MDATNNPQVHALNTLTTNMDELKTLLDKLVVYQDAYKKHLAGSKLREGHMWATIAAKFQQVLAELAQDKTAAERTKAESESEASKRETSLQELRNEARVLVSRFSAKEKARHDMLKSKIGWLKYKIDLLQVEIDKVAWVLTRFRDLTPRDEALASSHAIYDDEGNCFLPGQAQEDEDSVETRFRDLTLRDEAPAPPRAIHDEGNSLLSGQAQEYEDSMEIRFRDLTLRDEALASSRAIDDDEGNSLLPGQSQEDEDSDGDSVETWVIL
ncbi:hypothetical protein QBC39DRAFT_381892 [Podospora conica]|nr:hypothetical protein QBC39DRAFT_381892 [Schizothecium conicum]